MQQHEGHLDEALPRRAAFVAIGVAAVYAWVAAGFHPFSWPMRIAVAVPVVVAAAYQLRPAPVFLDVAPEQASAYRRCVAVWVALLVLAITWELTSLFSSPREDHPTLSSIADDVMRTHPGRAITFGLWLVVGWLVFVRPMVERRP